MSGAAGGPDPVADMIRAAEAMERAARIMLACTKVQVEIAGMVARNQRCAYEGSPAWHAEAAFAGVIAHLRGT